MQMSGQVHAAATKPAVPTQQETERASELSWTLYKKISLAPVGTRGVFHRSYSRTLRCYLSVHKSNILKPRVVAD